MKTIIIIFLAIFLSPSWTQYRGPKTYSKLLFFHHFFKSLRNAVPAKNINAYNINNNRLKVRLGVR